MTVTFETLKLRDVLFVCEHMRAADWIEVMNTLPRQIDRPDLVAMVVMQVSKIGLVAKIDGEPAALVQFSEILDGSWRVGMFGTDRFHEVARPLIRELIRKMVPFVLDEGVVYCDALADALHVEAHRLLEFIGFRRRALLEGYGSRGRDIALYVLTRGETNVLRKRFNQFDAAD